MVSKKLIKSYDFETIEDYFNYILDSETNGQRSQVESLIKALSTQQKKHCLSYFRNSFGTNKNADLETVQNLIFQKL